MSAGRGPALERTVALGLVVNGVLAVVKGVAGLVGHSYALVADAVESASDVLSSLVVLGGVRVAARDADEAYPFGYGKAEAVAAAVVGVLLGGAAVGIALKAIEEIRTPHHAPAPFTLVVLVGVVGVKELLSRRVLRVAGAHDSVAVAADAWHHRSDAITSAAAFVGISVAILGGPGWAPADDWAALVAAGVVGWTAWRTLRPALEQLMDRVPADPRLESLAAAIRDVDGVAGFHQLRVRHAGGRTMVDLHVQADGAMSLREGHEVSGRVKGAVRRVLGAGTSVLVHMEPATDGDDAA